MMKILLRTLVVGMLIVAPVVTMAASSGRTELPAAVDQLLARDMIQLAESNLKAAGLDPGPVDGIFDAQTEKAVLAFQQRNGLPTTGLLDETTRRMLLPGIDQDGEG
jgi:peptidoglycan hydrolase-like protein with peptidoglycan-binding domain